MRELEDRGLIPSRW
ncbi:hypothetical protein [Haloferax volcanii]